MMYAMEMKDGPENRTEEAGERQAPALDDAALLREGHLRCPYLRSLGPDRLQALLKEVAENNRLRREAEEREMDEIWNSLTAGLYGMIQGFKSMREDTKLINQIREKRRQKALAKQRAEEGEEKQP